jgi:hypothetical protein
MKELLTFIFYVIAGNERARIDETDTATDKWYELILTHTDNSKETVKRKNTFDEISKDCRQYMDKYRFDEINIVICENQELPKKIFHFFSDALVYSMIHDYYRFSELLENMRFVGKITFQKNDSSPKIKKAYYNYGEAADIFIDEIAFRYFRHLICYIPDNGEEDNPEDGCTYNDFLEITEGNTDLARHLFDEVTWEYPSTLYEQWASYGTLDELEKMYEEKTTVYSYTDSGDFVRCNNCDKTMLVPTGADKCPSCHYEGALAWADEEQQELTHSQLEETGKFRAIVKNELEPSEYLSVEALIEDFGSTSYKRFSNSNKNIWEIIDNDRTIYSGTEEEMKTTFQKIVDGKLGAGCERDLKLIEVHDIHK